MVLSEFAAMARGTGKVLGVRFAAFFALLALFAPGCQDDDSGPAGLPAPVAKTRTALLTAAERRDYDRLAGPAP
jgi:hypothetical protein